MTNESRGRCDICYVGDGVPHKPWCERGDGCSSCDSLRAALERAMEAESERDELREKVKRLEEAVEWACDKRIFDHFNNPPSDKEWTYYDAELRRRAGGGE